MPCTKPILELVIRGDPLSVYKGNFRNSRAVEVSRVNWGWRPIRSLIALQWEHQ